MRELGVLQCGDVILGPPPGHAEKRAVESRDASPERKAQIAQEVAAELRNARIREALDEVMDKLAATGHEYTDAELMRFISPERWAQIEALDA